MATPLFKSQVYAGVMEILKDKKYYYRSGISTDYDKFTEEGEQEIINFFKLMAGTMLKKEQEQFIKEAKSMVWDELKK